MQLPEKYKEKFDSVAATNFPTKGLLETSNISMYFSGSCIPTKQILVIIDTAYTGTDCSS